MPVLPIAATLGTHEDLLGKENDSVLNEPLAAQIETLMETELVSEKPK